MSQASLEKQSIAYVTVLHGLLHVLELAFGVVLIAVAADLGATMLVLGVLANIFGFAYGFTAMPVGVLTDRMSETRLLAICALGIGAASIGVALSYDTITLGIALAILGVALGIFHPVAMTFISRVATKIGLGYAYLGTGGNLGLALGPIIVGAIAAGIGWRFAYAAFAIPCIVIGVLILRLPKKIRPPAVAHDDPNVDTSIRVLHPVAVPIILILASNVMNGLVYRGVLTFLPTHLSESVTSSIAGVDPVMLGGSFTTVALIFGVGGQFLGGYLSDRKRRELLALIAVAISGPALFGVWSFSGAALLGFAALFAFFHFMTQPVYNALIADYCPDSWRGRMFGIYFFCAFGVGSFSASGLGYVAENQGITTVFLVCAFIGVISVFIMIPLLLRAIRQSKVVSSVDKG